VKPLKITNVNERLKTNRLAVLMSGVAIAALLGGGCMTGNPGRFHTNVTKWVPVGTSAEDATRIMERHGFQCSSPHEREGAMPGDSPIVECRRTNHIMNRVWVVMLSVEKNRVIGSTEQVFNDPLRLF